MTARACAFCGEPIAGRADRGMHGRCARKCREHGLIVRLMPPARASAAWAERRAVERDPSPDPLDRLVDAIVERRSKAPAPVAAGREVSGGENRPGAGGRDSTGSLPTEQRSDLSAKATAMTWGKVDDKLHAHPKVAKAGAQAMGLWVVCLSYVSAYESDGYLSATCALRLGNSIGIRRVADVAGRLIEAGLWVREDRGYRFKDYLDWNRSAAQIKADRDKVRERVTRYRERRENTPGNAVTGSEKRVTNADCNGAPDPTRPDLSSLRSERFPEHTHTAREAREGSGNPNSAQEAFKRPTVGAPRPPAVPETKAPPGHASGAAIDPSDPMARDVLAELRRHPALADVATARLAERLAGDAQLAGRRVADVLKAIADAARDAGSQADVGHPLHAPVLARMVGRYCANVGRFQGKASGTYKRRPEDIKQGSHPTTEADRAEYEASRARRPKLTPEELAAELAELEADEARRAS